MEKIYSFTLLIFMTIAPALVWAQKGFDAGYVVTLHGDTIHGLVENKNWRTNPNTIRFKHADGRLNLYSPTEIAGFGVDKDRYESFVLLIDKMPRQLDQVKESLIRGLDTVFLRTLVQTRELSLYHFIDYKEHLFLRRGGDIPQELYRNVFLRDLASKTVLVTQNEYQQQLATYFSDCPELEDKSLMVPFRLNDVRNLVKQYIGCKNLVLQYESKREPLKVELDVFGGAGSVQTSINGMIPAVWNGKFNSELNPAAGLRLNLVLPRSKNKYNIVNELMYRRFKIEQNMPLGFGSSDEVYHLRMALSYIVLNSAFRYSLVGKSKPSLPYILAGISNGFIIQAENTSDKTSNSGSGPQTSFARPFYNQVTKENDFRKHEQGFFAGAGLERQKLGLEFRYNRTNGYSSYTQVSTTVTNYMILLSYRLR